MENQISNMIAQFEIGKISRRQLVSGMSSLFAMLGTTSLLKAGEQEKQATGTQDKPTAGKKEKPAEPTFQATGLNHIALQVTNVPRSRDFYVKHLGLTVTRDRGEANCFLDCGKHFLALFKSREAQMDHYCYSIDNYDVDRCEATLKAQGFEPRVVRPDGRIYFKDPDGLTVQLAKTPK
jgi:catechol 2,3-dioxygenase-like lactoylglutathione lyase family enzyme